MKNVFGFLLILSLSTFSVLNSQAQSNEELFDSEVSMLIFDQKVDDVITPDVPAPGDVLDELAKESDLTTFTAALRASGLAEKMNSGDAFTILAPSNKAFDALPKGTVEQLLMPENQKKLQYLLYNHIIAGASDAEKVGGIKTLSCWSGQELKVDVGSAGVFVGDAKVVRKDLKVGNGIVHVIDKVLL